MDCREAQQVFSAMFDREAVDEATRTEAESHCSTCAECTEFRRALQMLAAAPAPTPPNDLADRVLTAAEAEALAAGGAPPLVTPVVAEDDAVPWLTRRRAYVMAGAAATALLIVGIAVWGAVVANNKATQGNVDSAIRSALSAQGGVLPPPGSGAAARAPATGTVSTGVAPNYVVYQTRVYQQSASIADTTALTQVGTLTSALSSDGSAQTRSVYRLSALSTATIILRLPDNTLNTFTPVARTFGALTYVLQSGQNIDRFGQWPTLPAQFNQPASADGSPTFRSVGKGASGVTVYTPSGASASSGIAVGPNPPSTDPGAGNPNWTWWTPI